MKIKTITSSILAIACSALLATACVEQQDPVDGKELYNQLVEQYASQGDIVFLTPQEDAFQFTSPEAQASFYAELEAEGFGMDTVEFRSVEVNGICTGSSSHSLNVNTGAVMWHFWTLNTSGQNKVRADVEATVWHDLGAKVECKDTNNESWNECFIHTNVANGYNTASAKHRACHRKNVFSSLNCTPWIATADSL